MVKHCGESVIEIWSTKYVNYPQSRTPDDRDAKIVQIEPGSTLGDYIVELVKK